MQPVTDGLAAPVLWVAIGLAIAFYGLYEITHAQRLADQYSRAPLYEPRLFPLFRWHGIVELSHRFDRRQQRPSPRRLVWDGWECVIAGCVFVGLGVFAVFR
jgi:hypothetical protein